MTPEPNALPSDALSVSETLGGGASEATAPLSTPPPPSVRSLRSIAALIVGAEEARRATRFDEAMDGYRKALLVMPEDDAPARVAIYMAMGDIKSEQGAPLEAERYYDKALGLDPQHRSALEALLALATARGD